MIQRWRSGVFHVDRSKNSSRVVNSSAVLLALFLWTSIAFGQASYSSSFSTSPKEQIQEGELPPFPPLRASAPPTTPVLDQSQPSKQTQSRSDGLAPLPPFHPVQSNPARTQPGHRENPNLEPVQPNSPPYNEVIPATPDEHFFTKIDETSPRQADPNFDSFRVRHDRNWPGEQQQEASHSSIALTNFSSPAEPAPAPATDHLTPAQLIQRYAFEDNPGSWGRPLLLIDVMRINTSANRKAEIINQYWETWMRWGRMQNCIRHRQWLDRIENVNDPHERLIMQSAKELADNQIAASKIDFKRAQIRLFQFLTPNASGTPNYEQLPFPADAPLVQKYNTNFELYRQQGRIPSRLFHINLILADTLDLINSQSSGVNLSKAATEEILPALNQGKIVLANLLEIGRVWKTAEENLITSVANYNRMIADYSMTVADLSHPPETLTAMLIVTPQNNPATVVRTSLADANQSRIPSTPAPPRATRPQPSAMDSTVLDTAENREKTLVTRDWNTPIPGNNLQAQFNHSTTSPDNSNHITPWGQPAGSRTQSPDSFPPSTPARPLPQNAPNGNSLEAEGRARQDNGSEPPNFGRPPSFPPNEFRPLPPDTDRPIQPIFPPDEPAQEQEPLNPPTTNQQNSDNRGEFRPF